MGTSSWTVEDESILMAHYESFGASWDGWAALLPEYSTRSIREKAKELGLAEGKRGHLPHAISDDEVMRLFRSGLAASRIDRILNMRNGFAHDVIVRMWAYEKDKFGSKS